MKKYIFYTSEGYTENNNSEAVENCQILGWYEGNNEKEAFANFKKENSELKFQDICCQELANDKVYYF